MEREEYERKVLQELRGLLFEPDGRTRAHAVGYLGNRVQVEEVRIGVSRPEGAREMVEFPFHSLGCIRVRRDQSSYALALDSSFSSALSSPLFRRLQYYLSSDRDYRQPPWEQAPQV